MPVPEGSFMMFSRHRLMPLLVLTIALPLNAQTLDKGHRLLIERGLQIQATSVTYDNFHLNTMQGANFTAPSWTWDYTAPDMSLLGAPSNGVQWARWIDMNNESDLRPAEQPYKPNMVSLSVHDEQYLDSPSNMDATVNWFTANASKFPNTILYTNQWGSETSVNAMRDLNSRAHPDMLSFDTYPFGPTNTSQWYTDAAKYQSLGKEFGIPVAFYLQTYHSTGDGARDPSGSELRWNQFAGWTFGFKMANAFIYNNGASSLFIKPGGDSFPAPLYNAFKETARQGKNLGRALVRLDSTDIRLIPGKHMESGTPVTNGLPSGIGNWAFGANGDPYISSITAASASATNNGLPGDILVGFFKVLREDMDGPASGEKYFMITNALLDPVASPEDTRQTITINFNFHFAGTPTSLLRLNRDTGLSEVVPLTNTGGFTYKLTFTLDGGTGDLFKYNDGTSFPVPEPAFSFLILPALLLVRRANNRCPFLKVLS
jgi:hypothetical protein